MVINLKNNHTFGFQASTLSDNLNKNKILIEI